MRIVFAVLVLITSLSSVSAADVSLTIDGDSHNVGDVILFSLHNDTDRVLQIVHAPPFCVWSVELAQQIFCGNLPDVVSVEPGEAIDLSWNTGWRPDAPGPYRIMVFGSLLTGPDPQDWESVEVSADYSLLSAVPTRQASWSAVKARH